MVPIPPRGMEAADGEADKVIPRGGGVVLNPLLCAFLPEKNALSWISHYSGSARSCGRLLNFSEFISNFIHMGTHSEHCSNV